MTRKRKIPSDADGFVPTDFLIGFESTREPRARLVDEMKVAGVVFAPQVTVKQAGQWMNRPNRYDIAGIDAPVEAANVPVGGFPRKRPRRRAKSDSGPRYSQAFWDGLDWENDPVGASRMAAMAMEVEKHGLTEDMRALIEDDAYGEVMGSDRWRHDDRAAAEAYRKHMLSDMDMYATANRKASYGRKPYEWEKLAGNVYSIRDAEGNYIDVTNIKEKGPGWFACANAWGLPYTKFRTKEEAIDFAESLLGMGR